MSIWGAESPALRLKKCTAPSKQMNPTWVRGWPGRASRQALMVAAVWATMPLATAGADTSTTKR